MFMMSKYSTYGKINYNGIRLEYAYNKTVQKVMAYSNVTLWVALFWNC